MLSLQETGLYEYKVIGTLSSCSPEDCADVYMDLAYRKQWDSYVKGNVRAGDVDHMRRVLSKGDLYTTYKIPTHNISC